MQIFRMGDRVKIKLNSSYRHYLDGLTGTVTTVLAHGVIVSLDGDPALRQQVVAPTVGRHTDQTQGLTGPKTPRAQRLFQFHEVEKL